VSEAFEWTYVRAGAAAPSFDAGQPHNFPINTFPVLEFLILSLLQHREMYGGEIAHVLAARMNPGRPPGTGVIYPLLKNMRRDGLLESYRTQGMARVYFRLTEMGETRLTAVGRYWADINAAVQSIAITAPEDRRYLSQGEA
jgi:PadR family transcriptional regulator PadR